jgi:hypothetical protein
VDASRWNEKKAFEELARLLRLYAWHKYGREVAGFSLDLPNGREGEEPHYEPLPPCEPPGP